MSWVFDIPMRSELGLDIFVPQQAHFRGEVFSVSPEKPAVEIDWREKGHRARGHALGRGHGRGHEAGRRSHGGRGNWYSALTELVAQTLKSAVDFELGGSTQCQVRELTRGRVGDWSCHMLGGTEQSHVCIIDDLSAFFPSTPSAYSPCPNASGIHAAWMALTFFA